MNVNTGYGDCTDSQGVFSVAENRKGFTYDFTPRETAPSEVITKMASAHSMPCSKVPVKNARGEDWVIGPFAINNSPAPRDTGAILEDFARTMQANLAGLALA